MACAHGSVIVRGAPPAPCGCSAPPTPCDVAGCPNPARWYYPKLTLFGWKLCDTCKDTDPRGVDCLPLEGPSWREPLAALRAAGWMVAVHNDYRQNGKLMTFWLFTREGFAVKGEGETDAEALARVMEQISRRDR